MKRLFVHVSVDDLEGSVAFYRALFGFEPATIGTDCAEWLLDDPGLDFAISRRTGGEPVLTRLGLQLDSAAELAELRNRLEAGEPADREALPEDGVDKHWMVDPVGVLWEAYHQQGARIVAAPSKADYFAARRASAEAEQRSAIVRHRRALRRRPGVTMSRPEARM